MRLPLLATATAATLLMASPALAFAGFYEEITFKQDLSEYGADGMSLCVLESNSTALFMTYRTVPEKYVLSQERCDSDQYGELSPEAENMLKEAGLLPPLGDAQIHLLPALALGGMALLTLFLFIGKVIANRR